MCMGFKSHSCYFTDQGYGRLLSLKRHERVGVCSWCSNNSIATDAFLSGHGGGFRRDTRPWRVPPLMSHYNQVKAF